VAQLKWETEYNDNENPSGDSQGRCPRCRCTLFEVRKTKSRSGNERLRYNSYEVRCANTGCKKRRHALPGFPV
jgi:hypothetical protein